MFLHKLDVLVREAGVIPPMSLDVRTLVYLAEKAELREKQRREAMTAQPRSQF